MVLNHGQMNFDLKHQAKSHILVIET